MPLPVSEHAEAPERPGLPRAMLRYAELSRGLQVRPSGAELTTRIDRQADAESYKDQIVAAMTGRRRLCIATDGDRTGREVGLPEVEGGHVSVRDSEDKVGILVGVKDSFVAICQPLRRDAALLFLATAVMTDPHDRSMADLKDEELRADSLLVMIH